MGNGIRFDPDDLAQPLAGTELLAGATATLAQGVARLAALPGITLADAITMATANPASFLPTHLRGGLQVGSAADLIRFHWQPGWEGLVFEELWKAGELCSR